MAIIQDIIVKEKANTAEDKLGEAERSNRETLEGRKIGEVRHWEKPLKKTDGTAMPLDTWDGLKVSCELQLDRVMMMKDRKKDWVFQQLELINKGFKVTSSLQE